MIFLNTLFALLAMKHIQGRLAMFFWNLAHDLYNVRQSKRLFPLMTAGGVVGLIVSSLILPIFKLSQAVG